MSETHKAILEAANAHVAAGNYEGFLTFCTDDTEWTFVGDQALQGKDAVRHYMATAYIEPPTFTVATLIAEGEFLTVLGEITIKGEAGEETHSAYCDVWRFRGGKIVALQAFVIKIEVTDDTSSAA